MTILITGSAGHLGEALMRVLRARGEDARGLDLNRSEFTQCVGSICDRELVRDCMAGSHAVIHTATLHKPHIATHSAQDFVETNVMGTLVLLEEAAAAGVTSFIYTSTTSVFGLALSPGPGQAAAWITEDVVPVPKNIYGATKLAAENLCEMFSRSGRLPLVILRTSRFFPEPDDDAEVRDRYELGNTQANELLYRRADLEDMVEAHLLAVERAPRLGFGRYIVSATTAFSQSDLLALRANAADVVHRHFPDCQDLFAARGWSLFPEIDRIYVNALARSELGWRPKYDFRHVLDCLRDGSDFRSELARTIGIKGYHGKRYADGIYPVVS